MGSLEYTSRTAIGKPVNVISLVGDLDAYSAPRLRDTMTAMIEAGDLRIVVDCTGLAYIDSSGLGALAAALKLSSEHYGLLILANLNESVMRVMQITGLAKLFPIYSGVDEACDACMLMPA